MGYLSCGTIAGGATRTCATTNSDIGFGRNANMVTNPNDDDAMNPRKGTLCYAIIRDKPLLMAHHGRRRLHLRCQPHLDDAISIFGAPATSGLTIAHRRGAHLCPAYCRRVPAPPHRPSRLALMVSRREGKVRKKERGKEEMRGER